VKEALIITAIDFVAAAVAVPLFGVRILDSIGLILLLEGAVIMLVGGALSFTGEASVRRVVTIMGLLERAPRNERNLQGTSERERIGLGDVRAAFYVITGLLLFSESMILAFVFVA